ncbi:MAG: hypothetical protein WCP21_14340, partial [Armatimonadota bacterium]
DAGDFEVGQGVMVSRCNVQYSAKTLWGPKKTYEAQRPLKDEVEMRGYDGAAGSWFVYVIDVAPVTAGTPSSFRWSDDLGRTWKQGGPVNDQWQALSGGTEIRFGKLDWEAGWTVTFNARDQLLTRIEKIAGNVLTLRDTPNRTATDAVVRHSDDEALRAAVDEGLKQKRNVFIPAGRYCLARGIPVRNPNGLVIEGVSAEDVVFDISEGEGSCFDFSGGAEATLRNATMVGNCGFADSDIAGYLNTNGARGLWCFYLKRCNAVSSAGTERLLVENCHARKMSCEAFVSGGPSRAAKAPRTYSKAITYLRCSAIDCGRNAFNDWNVGPENTSILQCRIVDCGGCSWEGASRFVKFIGNYVRNAGPIAMGNIGPSNRDESFGALGAGQHIVADNVFESGTKYAGRLGGPMIQIAHGATQIIVRDNLFINFDSTAISSSGQCDTNHFPSQYTTITGNIIDLTAVADKSLTRYGIDVSTSDTIVADNQVYVRGAADPLVTGLRVQEPALNVTVHDNLIRNCGTGLITTRARGTVTEVIDPQTFTISGWNSIPVARRPSDLYHGWRVVWLSGEKVVGNSVLEQCDPDTSQFKLREPRTLKVGDQLEIYPPYGANWDLHHNTISGCLKPLVLEAYGSETARVRENTVTRDAATGVTEAATIKGRFQVVGNLFSGFNEPGCVALGLYLDRLGQPPASLYRDNRFEGCPKVVGEEQKGMWEKAAGQAPK